MASSIEITPGLAQRLYCSSDRLITSTLSSTTAVWHHWVQPPTTLGSATTATWVTWTASTTAPTIETPHMTWEQWTLPTGQIYRVPVNHPIAVPVQQGVGQAPLTPEQAAQLIAQQRAREAAWQQERDAREAKQRAVKARAERTLLTLLTPEQERAWRENRVIFVTSMSGKRYQLKEGMAHNMHEIDADGRLLKELCVHVDYEAKCPVIDNLIAQILALRFNEQMLLNRANIWDCRQPNRPMIQRAEA